MIYWQNYWILTYTCPHIIDIHIIYLKVKVHFFLQPSRSPFAHDRMERFFSVILATIDYEYIIGAPNREHCSTSSIQGPGSERYAHVKFVRVYMWHVRVSTPINLALRHLHPESFRFLRFIPPLSWHHPELSFQSALRFLYQHTNMMRARRAPYEKSKESYE